MYGVFFGGFIKKKQEVVRKKILVRLRASHSHRKDEGSISAGGLMLDDEFFSTVSGLNLDICMIFPRDQDVFTL